MSERINYEVQNIISDNLIRNNKGAISIKSKHKSNTIIKLVSITLLVLTIVAFISFDYKDINILEAIVVTVSNIKSMVLTAGFENFSIVHALKQLLMTISLAFLTTLIGAVIALFISFFAATNLANKKTSTLIKSVVAFIRAIPTVLWVLIFAISVGLGSEAAIIGMSFHTIAYLVKAYSEVFEEVDFGVIEALKSSGASFWQINFLAIIPSCKHFLSTWTFLRFEINFTNAVAMGAAAGAGGIGFEMFMASNFYFNLGEVGLITLFILLTATILEFISMNLKKRYFV